MSAELNGHLTPEEQLTGALDTSAQLVGRLDIGTGSGGTGNYNDLSNKPQINNVTLSGNKTTADLHISYSDLEDKPTIPAAQVNSDWNSSSGVSEILNKPTIPDSLSELSDVDIGPGSLIDLDYLMWDAGEGKWIAAHGITDLNDLNDVSTLFQLANGQVLQYGNGVWFNNFIDYSDITNTPTIPAAQVNSDWNSVSGVSEILNKPNLATVATTGAYGDLSGTPDLTIQEETYTATKSSGAWVINKIQGKKFGHLYQLMIEFKGTGTAVAAGDNAFMGTITSGTIPSLPAVNSTFYYHTPIYLSVNNVGTIQVRIFNEALNFSSSDGVVISVMFLA